LNLGSICDGIEKANEVCFVGSETWACGRRTDFGDADGAAGEGGHEEPRGQVAVALELEEGLDGFVGHGYGCVGGFVVEEKAAQEDGR
jgi:hypothetical protein